MNSAEAIRSYPRYTRYHTKKQSDLLLVRYLSDPESDQATGVLVVDLDRQVEFRVDIEIWENGLATGEMWRVYPK